ncbi:MAG: hypothetical protein LUC97_07685 [Clostridiales bacterium]|nr:hypothetical protein [Clostridiales bacterium]
MKKILAMMISCFMAFGLSTAVFAENAESKAPENEAESIISDISVSDSALVTLSLGSSSNEAETADENSDSSITVSLSLKNSELTTLNGYIAEISYNPEAIIPTICGTDVLGQNLYAENALDIGCITTHLESGKLTIGWANSDYVSLDTDTVLADITFSVIPDGDFTVNEFGTFANVETTVYQIARYSDIMYDGEFTYSENHVVG